MPYSYFIKFRGKCKFKFLLFFLLDNAGNYLYAAGIMLLCLRLYVYAFRWNMI